MMKFNQKRTAEKEIFCKGCDCKNCDGCISGSNWHFNGDSETYEKVGDLEESGYNFEVGV